MRVDAVNFREGLPSEEMHGPLGVEPVHGLFWNERQFGEVVVSHVFEKVGIDWLAMFADEHNIREHG